MNWKLMTMGTTGLMMIIASLIDTAANDRCARTVIDKAVAQRTDEENEAWKESMDIISEANQLNTKERKLFDDRMNEWKSKNNYVSSRAEIHKAVKDELDSFKDSIGYSERRQGIEDEFEDNLEAFKDSIDYDYEMDVLKTTIKEAENKYKSRCKKLESVSGSDEDISDALKDLKKNEKEKMNETVKEAKASISELNNKLSAEKSKLERQKSKQLRELEAELQATKTRLNKEENDKCSAIDRQKYDAEGKIRADIKNTRSEREQYVLDNLSHAEDQIKYQNERDHSLAEQIYHETPTHEKWAEYFKSRDIPKGLIGFAGALPLIPIGYLLTRYVRFVFKVMEDM